MQAGKSTVPMAGKLPPGNDFWLLNLFVVHWIIIMNKCVRHRDAHFSPLFAVCSVRVSPCGGDDSDELHACLTALLAHGLRPDAGLSLTDMCLVEKYHAQTTLTDASTYGQRK